MGPKKRGRPKKKDRTQCGEGLSDVSDNFCDFKALFAVIKSFQGIKPQVLKSLYGLLVQMSSSGKCGIKFAVDSHDFEVQICHNEIKIAFADICEITNILFNELEERFERFFTTFCGDDASKNSSYLDLLNDVEVINLLLRCCLLLLPLLASQQDLIMDKGQILLKVLGRLSSPVLLDNKPRQAFVLEKKSVFRGCSVSDNGCIASSVEEFTASLQFLEPHNPSRLLMSTMLEVFVDELMVHGQLRGYLKSIKSVASGSVHNDICIVIEAICYHFILSFSDKTTYRDFLDRPFSLNSEDINHSLRAPALGVTAAVSLLLSPIMNSAPKYVQAHFISLVTEAVEIKILEPDSKLIKCLLAAFEKSVIMYVKHMCFLQIDGYSANDKGPNVAPQFKWYISPHTKDKIDSLIAKLDLSSNFNLKTSFFRMKSDLVASSMRFLKEWQKVHTMESQDKVFAILSCLVLKASESFNNEEIRPIECESLQDVYLLASILNLMSISLLQAINCLRKRRDSCGRNTFENISLCKEYKSIMGSITCFRYLNIPFPLQQYLFSVLYKDSTRHASSKRMFLHFCDLMSWSFASGLDCLVNGCLFALFALLNLFASEEGGLGPLQTILDADKESFSSGSSVVRIQETVVDQKSSLVVAAKFQKIRSLCSSVKENKNDQLITSTSESIDRSLDMDAVLGLEEETEETTNGEIYLNCMIGKGKKVSDFEDLASFIECKQGKDYSAWLKNREKYRKWKFEKMAILKWKRKKKTWRTSK